MLKKIKLWWANRGLRQDPMAKSLREETVTFTRDQLEKAFILGYNDGKRDGLTIARQQATKSLKEILWQQNKKTTPNQKK